jgi:signal transduction histidine kinase
MRAENWLRMAGFVTWLVSGVPAMLAISSGRLDGAGAVVWVAAFIAFGAAFWVHAKPDTPQPRWLGVTLLTIQSAAGLTMVTLTSDGLPAATLVIVAAQLPHVVRTRGAVAWVAIQSLVLAAIFWRMDGTVAALAAGGAFAGFQMFAITTAWLARSESLARQDLARANAELHATRALLAENSRVAERLRIACDLHDTLGHHLTALSLQLEVASRLAENQAAEHVLEAHAITRLLLSDVRDVVSPAARQQPHRPRRCASDACRGGRSARNFPADGGRLQQPRGRRRARHGRGNRQESCVEHPVEARRARSHVRRAEGAGVGLHLIPQLA